MSTKHDSFVNTGEERTKKDELLEMWTRKDGPHHKDSNVLDQKINFLIPKCHACKDEIWFAEGDVIFGDRWYHNSCWKESQEIQLLSQ